MPHLRNAGARRESAETSGAITSRENRWLKRYRDALSGEHSEDGFVGVEGVRLVEAAVGSGLHVESLLLSASGERHLARVARLLPRGVPILRTTDRLFAGVAGTQSPQGIAALVRPAVVELEDLVAGVPLIVVLVGIQDPGNVGTILRSAEAFGATGAATCAGVNATGTADPFGPKAMRSSAGSALRLPVLRGISPAILLEQLRVSGLKLFAAVADSSAGHSPAPEKPPPSLRPWEIDWKSPAALLIGNEGSGLPEEIVRLADARVAIPQATAQASAQTGAHRGARSAAGLESLNAAMAATVLLYEAMRQRQRS